MTIVPTLLCDGCGMQLGTGRGAHQDLQREGGAAFRQFSRGVARLGPDDDWTGAELHLCRDCVLAGTTVTHGGVELPALPGVIV